MTYMYEDVRSRKFYCEDVLKKKNGFCPLSVFRTSHSDIRKEIGEKKKKKKLDLVSTHI